MTCIHVFRFYGFFDCLNTFWSKCGFWELIEENGWLILDVCMITNKILPRIAWKLVWFMIYVCWVSIWMFIMFLVFDLFLSKRFYVFVFFLVLIYFLFNCLFCISFGSNHGFQFGSGLNQCFRVNPIGFAWLVTFFVEKFLAWGVVWQTYP
jgi:hypothetical protein